MEIRFSMTRRLVAVALACVVALMVLMFLLGVQIGKHANVAELESRLPIKVPSPVWTAPVVPSSVTAPVLRDPAKP